MIGTVNHDIITNLNGPKRTNGLKTIKSSYNLSKSKSMEKAVCTMHLVAGYAEFSKSVNY